MVDNPENPDESDYHDLFFARIEQKYDKSDKLLRYLNSLVLETGPFLSTTVTEKTFADKFQDLSWEFLGTTIRFPDFPELGWCQPFAYHMDPAIPMLLIRTQRYQIFLEIFDPLVTVQIVDAEYFSELHYFIQTLKKLFRKHDVYKKLDRLLWKPPRGLMIQRSLRELSESNLITKTTKTI